MKYTLTPNKPRPISAVKAQFSGQRDYRWRNVAKTVKTMTARARA